MGPHYAGRLAVGSLFFGFVLLIASLAGLSPKDPGCRRHTHRQHSHGQHNSQGNRARFVFHKSFFPWSWISTQGPFSSACWRKDTDAAHPEGLRSSGESDFKRSTSLLEFVAEGQSLERLAGRLIRPARWGK